MGATLRKLTSLFANCLLRLGHLVGEAGLRELQKSLDLLPSYGPAHAESATIYYQLGDYAAAWREVKQSRALGSEPPTGLVAGLTHKMPQPQ